MFVVLGVLVIPLCGGGGVVELGVVELGVVELGVVELSVVMVMVLVLLLLIVEKVLECCKGFLLLDMSKRFFRPRGPIDEEALIAMH
jgi:hypothetical protein